VLMCCEGEGGRPACACGLDGRTTVQLSTCWVGARCCSTGQMCNIDESGATSMMFHSFPFVNEFDPNSGDYGLGFFGHSVQAGAYYVQHPQWGETCYLCDVSNNGGETGSVSIRPRDSYRQRVFLAPLGLYIVTRTGVITAVDFDEFQGLVTVWLSAASCFDDEDATPLFSRFVVEVRISCRVRISTRR
jgi:hypothetical protein